MNTEAQRKHAGLLADFFENEAEVDPRGPVVESWLEDFDFDPSTSAIARVLEEMGQPYRDDIFFALGYLQATAEVGKTSLWHLYEAAAPTPPPCGHSACSQHYIDTGSRECVEKVQIPLTWEITRENWERFAVGVLTTAAEGAIGYWANYYTDRLPAGHPESPGWVCRIRIYGEADGDDPRVEGVVDSDRLLQGFLNAVTGRANVGSYVHDQYLAALSSPDCLDPGEIDADGADVLVQLALFGEVVYG